MLRQPDEHAYLRDCNTCREINSLDERQQMACGWEPPIEGAVAWCHEGYDVGELSEECPHGNMYPRTCVGYTSKLPPVLEITWDRVHWAKGTLKAKLKGEPLELELRMLELLETQSNDVETWLLKNPKKP